MFQHKITLSALCLMILMVSFSAIADVNEVALRNYPQIYPFIPLDQKEFIKSVKTFTEDKNYIINIYDVENQGLSRANAKVKPWMSSYWPLNKGLIADPYIEKLGWNPFRLHREVSWQANHRRLTKRIKKIHQKWHRLDQDELDELSPSEKYDLLLGDTSFKLTKELRDYMYKWGSKKEFGFLTKLDKVGGGALNFAKEMVRNGQFSNVESALPLALELRGGLADKFAAHWVKTGHYNSFEQALPAAINRARTEARKYELEDKTVLMGLWEGICHGWSTAAGIVPRPTRTVSIRLDHGKYLNFFPSDIKGLASLMWANSLIQDSLIIDGTSENVSGGGVIMEGLRCNNPDPETDQWGRFYDATPDKYSKKLEPRCVGVHPALWHLALVNVIGKQGRSFIVERKVTEKVDNHPLYGYRSWYFNPYNGKYGSLTDSLKEITPKDQFYRFRSPEAKFIVGVKTAMTYIDYDRPSRSKIDHPGLDKTETIEMLYDLELDSQGNIVGGQWRAKEVGKPNWLLSRAKRTQPDFFWVITKNWQRFFPENTQISPWRDLSRRPPRDWLAAAHRASDFKYRQTQEYGWNKTCKIVHKDTDRVMEVPCEFEINKPQPLVNVVNTLLKLSNGQ